MLNEKHHRIKVICKIIDAPKDIHCVKTQVRERTPSFKLLYFHTGLNHNADQDEEVTEDE